MKSMRLSLRRSTPVITEALLRGSDGEGDKGAASGDAGAGGAGASTTEDGEKGKVDDGQAKITALEAEKNRHWEAKKSAEKERDDALAKLKEIEEKDLSEVEKAKTASAKLEAQLADQTKLNQELALKVAFLQDNTYQWHNPERALALADLSKVTIGKDGKVEGLKSALEALAKSDAYLVKPTGDAEVDDKAKKDPPPRTGGPAGGGKQGAAAEAEKKAELLKKYPALRQHTS